MSTNTIRNGSSVVVNLQPAETLKIVAVSGTYSLNGVAGSVLGTVIATAATGGTYGPYAAPVTVRITSSALSEVDYDSGTNPRIDSDTVAMVSTDPLTGVIGLSAGGIPQAITQPITTPSGFRGTTLAAAMDMRRTLGGIVTNFDITSLIPAVAKAYYVDPINGSNANSGLTAPLAKKDLAVVLAIADCDQIIITGLTADFVGLGAQSWNNVQPTRSMSIINNTGYRYISAACASLPTWAVNGTYSNVYSTVITAANASGVSDVSVGTVPTSVNASGSAISLTDVPKQYRTLVKVANLAAVAATAGTWFHDGTSLHVRAHDDRNLVGDTKMLPTTTAQNGRFPNSVTGADIYVKGIDFVGGQNAFAMIVGAWATATGGASGQAVINTTLITNTIVNGMSVQGVGVPAGTTVVSFVANTSITLSNNLTLNASGVYSFYWPELIFAHNNCSFQGASVGNGLNILAFAKVYGYRSGAYNNYSDGFNYHSNESDGVTAGTSPDCVEVECVAAGNGTTGSTGTSDNATTGHDYCNVIRLNCNFPNSSDRVLADTNSCHSWNLGCVVGQATTVAAGKQNIASLATSKMWLDSVYAVQGPNPAWIAAQTSTLKHFFSGSVVQDPGGGEATGTVAAYYG